MLRCWAVCPALAPRCTVTNVQAGGRTPLSGVVHSLVLLVVTLGAGGLASVIPMAVLAGILVNVGIEIVDWNFCAARPGYRPYHRLDVAGVCSSTIFWDLVTAVVVGVFVANVLTIKGLTTALERKTQRFGAATVTTTSTMRNRSCWSGSALMWCCSACRGR